MQGDSIVAKNVSRIIQEKGLKACAIAVRANIKPNQLSSLLHGRKQFRSDHILRLSQVLEVTPSDLFALDIQEGQPTTQTDREGSEASEH